MVQALRAQGLGLVVDVVPNHVAVPVPETGNQVLWQVLQARCRLARTPRWFDVDWSAHQPILIPVLGQRIGAVLAGGEITLDRSGAEPVLRYHDHVWPVRPGTEELPLPELVDAQHYRLAYWRVGDEELNYRRFFDVDTLAAIRVEDPQVFAESHALLVALVHEGKDRGAADRPPRRPRRPARATCDSSPRQPSGPGSWSRRSSRGTRRCPPTGSARGRRATTRSARSTGCSSTQPGWPTLVCTA